MIFQSQNGGCVGVLLRCWLLFSLPCPSVHTGGTSSALGEVSAGWGHPKCMLSRPGSDGASVPPRVSILLPQPHGPPSTLMSTAGSVQGCWRGCEGNGTLIRGEQDREMVRSLWKPVLQLLKKLKVGLQQNPAIPPQGIYSKDLKEGTQRDRRMHIHSIVHKC